MDLEDVLPVPLTVAIRRCESPSPPYNAIWGETSFIMNIVGEEESIEAVFVEMDPVQDGFCGVLIELVAVGEGYAVVETAAGSGNRLLRFRSRSQALARSLFESELRPALARSVEEQRCTREIG